MMKHSDFSIGGEFMTAGEFKTAGPGGAYRWRCTDVGTRTIVAIRINDLLDDPSWLEGPPYGVVELVFDEDDFGGCWETE